MNKLKIKIKNYTDITYKWLKTRSNTHIVKEQAYFDFKGKRYHVDSKNVVLDYSQKELEIAHFLVNTLAALFIWFQELITLTELKLLITYGIMNIGI